MAIILDNATNAITLEEHVGSPNTPAAGSAVIYAKADGYFYGMDDGGNEIKLPVVETAGQVIIGNAPNGATSFSNFTVNNATGALTYTGNASTSPGDITLTAPVNSNSSGTSGASILAGGAANFSSLNPTNGGAATLQGGAGNGPSLFLHNGGPANVYGGSVPGGGSGQGLGGDVNIATGQGYLGGAGYSGNIFITTPDAAASVNTISGAMVVKMGDNSYPGLQTITSTATDQAYSSSIHLEGGDGISTGLQAGRFYAASGQTATRGSTSLSLWHNNTNDVELYASSILSGAGNGGIIDIKGGTAGTTGNGGSVRLRGGATTAGDNGDVIIGAGQTSSSRDGDMMYIPSTSGIPTGAPNNSNAGGRYAMLFNTAANALQIYNGSEWQGGSGMYVNAFTKNLADASGSQSVTGVGFRPKAVIGFVTPASGSAQVFSLGFSNQTNNFSTTQDSTTAGSFDGEAFWLWAKESNTNYQLATIASFDADGFTISWTKNGTPTASVDVVYLAMG